MMFLRWISSVTSHIPSSSQWEKCNQTLLKSAMVIETRSTRIDSIETKVRGSVSLAKWRHFS